MPRIPTYDHLTVAPSAAPNIEGALGGMKVSPNALDGIFRPNEQEAHDLGSLGRVLGEVATRQQHQTNVASVLRAEADLKDQYAQFHAQLAQRQGTNAVGATADTVKWWDDSTKKIEEKLQNPAQQQAFKQRAAMLKSQSVATVSQFEADQRRQSLVDSANASLQTSVNFAASNAKDPGIVGQTEDDMKGQLATVAELLGWTPQILQEKTLEATTQLHQAVIDALSVNHPLAAQDYFKLHKNEISGTARTNIERTLHAGTVKQIAQDAGDYVMSKGMDMQQALAYVRKRYSGDNEDAAVREIHQRFAEQEQEQAQNEKQAADQAFQIYAQTGDLSRVPPATLAAMNGKTRLALQTLAAKASEAKPVETKWDVYAQLRTEAFKHPDGFKKVDLRQYFPDLAPAQRKDLIDLQDNLYKPDKLPQLASVHQQLEQMHNELGWTTANNQKDIGQYDAAVLNDISAERTRLGRALTYQERQQIMDRLAVQGKIAGSGRLWDTKEYFYKAEGTPDAARFVPKIPQKDKAEITGALQRHGMQVTPANIQWLYELELGLPAPKPDNPPPASGDSPSPWHGMPGSPTANHK